MAHSRGADSVGHCCLAGSSIGQTEYASEGSADATNGSFSNSSR